MDGRIVKLAQSSAIYGLGNMLQRFSGLLLLPIFTHFLTTEEYGVYALLTVIGALAQPIFGLGMNAAMGPSYFKAENALEKDRVIWTALAISVVSATTLLSLAWLKPELALKFVLLDDENLLPASIFLSGIAANIVTTPLAQKLQFQQKAKYFITIRLLGTLTSALLSVFTVVILRRGMIGMIEAQTAGYVLTLILFFISARPKSPITTNKKVATKILKTGIPLVPSFAFLFIMANAGRYALQIYSGESAVGTYSVGLQIGTAINILVGALATAWYPFFMAYIDKPDEASHLFGKLTSYYVLFIGLACLIAFSCADVVLHYLVDQAFYEARRVVGPISLAYAFTGLFNILLPPVYFGDRVFVVAPIQACAACISIALAVILCPTFGLIGATWSMVGSHFAMALGLHLYNRTSRNLTFKIYYNKRLFIKFGICAIIIITLSSCHTPIHTANFYLKPLSLASASLLSVWLCLDKSDRNQILSILKQKCAQLKKMTSPSENESNLR